MHKGESLDERGTDGVRELWRSSAGPTFSTIYGNKVGVNARLKHGLYNGTKLFGLADTKFKTNRLASR